MRMLAVAAASMFAGCLRETSHPCETPGACEGADGGSDADGAPDSDGSVSPDADVTFDWGDGHHGNITVTPVASYINSYGFMREAAAAGATLIVASRQSSRDIGAWADGFNAGDRIMIWRTTGLPDPAQSGSAAPVVLDGDVGRWFVTRVVSRSADNITIADPLPFACPADTQVILIPELDNVTVPATTGISARDWQGRYGGLTGFYANQLTIDGGIVEASADGFNGGDAENFGDFSNCSNADGRSPSGGGAAKGESFVLARFGTGADARAGRGNIYHGGGGGNCSNAGGGGGSHAGIGGIGGNDGALRVAGGLPGAPVRYSPATHLVSGGGGGAGEDNGSQTGDGGYAGGVVWLTVRHITCTNGGEIAAVGGNGLDATDDGAGGGGGGGLVWIRAESIDGCDVYVNGGSGGYTNGARGPGGGGGGGRIVIVTDSSSNLFTEAAGGSAGDNGTIPFGAASGQPGAICGNGAIDSGESCDDGNFRPGDACTYCSE
jgi:large repetitive protein